MRLPAPPFFYRYTDAVLFIPDDTAIPASLWGSFPVAPTGPFDEIWKMRQTPAGVWTIHSIWVNNMCRMQAGRVFWNMPKYFQPVAIGIGAKLAQARVGSGHGIRSSLTWEDRLPPTSSRSFEFHLSLPSIEAALSFERASEPIEACLIDNSAPPIVGIVLHLGGEAELSIPVPALKIAA